MRIRGVIGTAAIVWALALGTTARAHFLGVPGPSPAPQTAKKTAEPPPSPTNDDCLACHDDTSLKRENGTPVHVDKDAFGASVHGPLTCVDCHQGLAHAEFPHQSAIAKVDCAQCHTDQVALYKQSVHAQARSEGNVVAATCVNCHGTHDIRGNKDPQSRTYHLNVAQTCARCHGNQDVILRGHIVIGDVTKMFADSIHGRALSRSGLMVAPTCSDCHSAHDIRKKSDPASKVALANVPSTCGKCHEGIERQFEGSVHGTLIAKGSNGAPACQTCHTAHSIRRAEDPQWQIGVIGQCGTCHADKIKTYRDTFHGQVTNLGFRAVATCADCHGNHRILPVSDPQSPLSAANRVQTCRKCHYTANANFAQYDPHADKHDRRRNPLLYVTARFMQTLLFGTFGFFGLHTLLWALRTSRPGDTHGKGDGHASAD